jgi:Rod binding domain-containing protein
MSSVIPQTPLTAELALTPPLAKTSKAAAAAKQFEGLLIAQMLRSTRESNADEDDSADSPMIDLAEQHFSQLLANNGGLGLSRLVMKGLENADR